MQKQPRYEKNSKVQTAEYQQKKKKYYKNEEELGGGHYKREQALTSIDVPQNNLT